MITPGKVLVGIICGVIVGCIFSVQSLHIFSVHNAPLVSGRIISRAPVTQYGVPRVDFTIQIDGTETQVHAHAQRYLINKTPEKVRFHYNGDPTREVFLFEHEENPYWIAIFGWGVALLLTLMMTLPYFRRKLGWET